MAKQNRLLFWSSNFPLTIFQSSVKKESKQIAAMNQGCIDNAPDVVDLTDWRVVVFHISVLISARVSFVVVWVVVVAVVAAAVPSVGCLEVQLISWLSAQKSKKYENNWTTNFVLIAEIQSYGEAQNASTEQPTWNLVFSIQFKLTKTQNTWWPWPLPALLHVYSEWSSMIQE